MAYTYGVDYSWDPPTPAEIIAWGQTMAPGKRYGVGRYVSTPGASKNLTSAERIKLQAAGLDIWIVGQISKDRALGGYAQGVTDMRSFVQQVRDIGGPWPSVIRMSVDFDVVGLSVARGGQAVRELDAMLADAPSAVRAGDPDALAAYPDAPALLRTRALLRAGQMDTVLDYLRGGASIVGTAWTGPYGERDVCRAAADRGFPWLWQTLAWSGGVWEPRAQIQQYKHDIVLGSGKVDYNRIMTPSYGQWGKGDWFDMATAADLENVVKKVMGVAGGEDTVAARLAALSAKVDAQEKILRMAWYGSKLREVDGHDQDPGSLEGMVANFKAVKQDLAAIKVALGLPTS